MKSFKNFFKNPFKRSVPAMDPSVIGKYKRTTDSLSDIDQKKEVAELLQWLEEEVPEHKVESKSDNRLRDLLNAGIQLEQLNKIAAIAALKNAKAKGTIIDRLVDILKDIFYATRDLISSNRVKTSLTMIGCIGLGAVIGGAIGSVIPVIGNAIGGAVGGAIGAELASGIATFVAALGGTLGLGVLGAFGGSWVGKKISDKSFKHEKRFEISKRVTRKIKSRTGVSSRVAQMINGYLYNRAKTVSSPLCKKYYKLIRRLAILEADPTAMEKVSRFFCQELILLKSEMKGKNSEEELRVDQDAIRYILKKLKKASGLSSESRDKIEAVLKVEYEEEISPEVLRKAKNKFIKSSLSELGILAHPFEIKQAQKTISYRYGFNGKLPDMEFSTNDKRNETSVTLVDPFQLTEENMEEVIQAFLLQAEKYREITGNNELVIMTGRTKEVPMTALNKKFAIRLWLAANEAGLDPTLDNKEYPKDDPERKEILDEIAGLVQRANT